MNNLDLRCTIIRSGHRMWEIAEVLGIREETLSRKLRHELTTEEAQTIRDALAELEKEDTK